MKTLSVNIPFCGFYESYLSYEMNSILEREIEYTLEREREDGLREYERLDDSTYAQIFDRNITNHIWERCIANQWVEYFESYLSDIVETKISFTFAELTSPREYNFETDRIFATMTLKDAAKLFAKAKADSFADLAACIKERFTSRDGFISFYSNDLDDWLAKPLSQWDSNELGTLVLSFLKNERDIEFNIFESLTENGAFYEGLWSAINNDQFEKDILEARQEKLEEHLANDPDFVPPAPRCPLTLNMSF